MRERGIERKRKRKRGRERGKKRKRDGEWREELETCVFWLWPRFLLGLHHRCREIMRLWL